MASQLPKILSLCFAVACVLLFSLLAERLIPRWRFAALPVLFWCYNRWFTRWFISSVEASLTVFLPLLSILLYSREQVTGSLRLAPSLRE